MSIDKQAQATIYVALAQVALTAVIAALSGFWAYATYTGEQQRIQEQQSRDERQAQSEAIAQMSRQLGAMQAQCDADELLRSLLDGGSVTRREEQCHNVYIEARSLVFFSRHRILPESTVPKPRWNAMWNSLEVDLIQAGARGYDPETLSNRWKKIVDNSKGNGGRNEEQESR